MKDYRETLMWKEISQTPAVLAGLRAVNEHTVAAIAREVREKNVRNVTGAARGTSDHALIFFKYLVEVFSPLKVGLGACSAVTMYDGKVNYGDNLVVGVSQSGKAADVLAVLRRADEQGAVTVAVTNDCNSPMAKAAKYHCNAGEEKSVAATKTFSAQTYLLLLLAAALSGDERLTACAAAVPADAADGFEGIKAQALALAPQLKGIEDGFILARGISYAIALESTLKLQETCYIRMKGYAESDFQHGPMAMVGKDTPVLVYAPTLGFVDEQHEQAHFEAFAASVKRLQGFGGKLYVVSDNPAYGQLAPTYPIGDSACEVCTFFRFALFAQMLACFVSCNLGNNPDAPRALNKVTITK